MQVSCCGCYSVRTGTIITGIFDIISWIIMLILIFALNVKSEMIEMNVDLDVVRIVSAIYLCMAIFIAIILLVGVFKRIPFMMLPWIVLSLILGVLLLISIIYVATILFVNNKVMSGVLLLEFAVIGLVIYTIMWLVVFSHFQELRQDKMNSSIGRYGKPHKYQRANQN